MSQTLASQLPRLRAALQRTASHFTSRWLSESLRAGPSHAAHPVRSAGHATQSRHAAGRSILPRSLGNAKRAHMHSEPLGLSTRSTSSWIEAAGASCRVTTPEALSRLLLASKLVPSAHVVHSTAVAPLTGCELALARGCTIKTRTVPNSFNMLR